MNSKHEKDRVRSIVDAARAQLAPIVGTAVLVLGVVGIVFAPEFAREELSARLQTEAPAPEATAVAVALER